MQNQTMISIIGHDVPQVQSKGPYGQLHLRQSEVSTDILQSNLSAFVKNLDTVFDQVITSIKEYELSEIEVKVDVSVAGGISLIGSVATEATGGITLRFRRMHNNE